MFLKSLSFVRAGKAHPHAPNNNNIGSQSGYESTQETNHISPGNGRLSSMAVPSVYSFSSPIAKRLCMECAFHYQTPTTSHTKSTCCPPSCMTRLSKLLLPHAGKVVDP